MVHADALGLVKRHQCALQEHLRIGTTILSSKEGSFLLQLSSSIVGITSATILPKPSFPST